MDCLFFTLLILYNALIDFLMLKHLLLLKIIHIGVQEYFIETPGSFPKGQGTLRFLSNYDFYFTLHKFLFRSLCV